MAQPRLHFSPTLNFPDLSKLMDDLVCHNLAWPPIRAKLPSDVMKFQGKNNEDTRDHVTTFHLWFSSNLLNHDSFQLQFFQCTLTSSTMKWYIEIPWGTYRTFNDLALVFLNQF